MNAVRWTVRAVLGLVLLIGTQSAARPLLRPGELDATLVPQYENPLVIPPVMPRTSVIVNRGGKNADYYEIAVRQFEQQVLPPSMPATTVWSYGSINHPDTFNYPAFTIEAKAGHPVRVKWINQLVDANGHYLPHLLPVDQTLHWANPGRAGGAGIDDRPPWASGTPGPYTGPVPMIVHLHGGHSAQEDDGFPEAWYLPAADIPEGYATTGSLYDYFESTSPLGSLWGPGYAVFEYDNVQRASTLWYHDHTVGMTRLNVYAGPAGFYLVRGGAGDVELGYRPPKARDNPRARTVYTELPLVIQDRSFRDTSSAGDGTETDGSLFYPDARVLFDEYPGPFVPETDVPPIWNPEAFFNTMVVNGKAWPSHDVEQRRYRLRLLNGCNSRFLILKLVDEVGRVAARPATPLLDFDLIGTEGGFVESPVPLPELLLAPAERADVIIDFGALAVGTVVYLVNEGPDEPFGGGLPGTDFDAADPGTTGQVMRFVVTAPTFTGPDPGADPATLVLPRHAALGPATTTRQVSLNEMMSAQFDGPVAALLGTVAFDGEGAHGSSRMWEDAITENPGVGTTEMWEIFNFTEDAHPIHLHEIMFEVVERAPLGGLGRAPEIWELGLKDTVIAYPGEITRIKAVFDRAGLFVWHCHILEHEDNEMMRAYHIGTPPPDLPLTPMTGSAPALE